MKKLLAFMAAMILMAACALPAMAQTLSFPQRNFYGGQTLPVYRGPGEEYGRGGNGWAKASTDEALYAAGKENGWAMVMYGTKGGSVRVGWVDLSQFKYNTKILKLEDLYFEYRNATVTTGCTLTDDPALNNRDLAYLPSGARVTYLGSFYKHRSWAYIETWVEGKPIRAFVPMDCLSIN